MALVDFGLWLRRPRGPSDFGSVPRNVLAGLVAERKAWLDEFAALVPGAEIQPVGPRIEQVVAMVGGRPCSWRVGETTPAQAAQSLRIELFSNPEQFDSQPAILDDPRMGGVAWLAAPAVTDVMLAAWPVWETRRRSRTIDDGVRWARYLRTWFSREDLEDWEYRPQRLPGMNARGEVAAADMTPEHFLRVERWQHGEPGDWRLFGADGREHGGELLVFGWRDFLDSKPRNLGSQWRPAIWAELDET